MQKRKPIEKTKNFHWFNTNFREKTEDLIRKKNSIYWYLVELMITKNNRFYRLYPNAYIESVRKEIEIANITKEDKILNIGCGPFPNTAIIISEITGAKVVAMDKNKFSTILAKKYLNDKNIKNTEIRLGDAINYPMKDFDVILITNCATPRKKIIENVLKKSKSDCRIICREVKNTKSSIREYVFLCGGTIKKEIKHDSGWGWYSYLILKKP